MKTLFRKSNLLHIRTNEGEFEVINPTAIGFSVVISDTMESFLNRFIKPGERIEWPGGIEKVCSCECQVKPMFCFFDCQQDKTIRIRLLPKEEKKDKIPVGNDGFGFDEGSTYKKSEVFPVESSEPQEKGFIAVPKVMTERNAILSRAITWISEDESPRAKEIIQQLSGLFDAAPYESQEEMWWSIIKRAKESYHFSSTSGNEMAHFIMEMKSLFTITRNP